MFDIKVEWLVTECPTHGTKVTADEPSARIYTAIAETCMAGSTQSPAEHTAWHRVMGHDCWACCDRMVIDPHGYYEA